MIQRARCYWEGSSKKDFKKFPIDVQKDMGVALFIVQARHIRQSPWKGLGPVCMNWWKTTGAIPSGRLYSEDGDAVHVLHAFQKKSSGIATPQPDVELIEKRLKACWPVTRRER